MTKVHLVSNGYVLAARPELEGVTPIRPLSPAAVLQLVAPTSDEWPIPRPQERSISFALSPDLARKIGQALLAAADEVDP